MDTQELMNAIKDVGLGGAGWLLFFLVARYSTMLQGKIDTLHNEKETLLINKEKETQERLKLLEQRLFDLKASAFTVE